MDEKTRQAFDALMRAQEALLMAIHKLGIPIDKGGPEGDTDLGIAWWIIERRINELGDID